MPVIIRGYGSLYLTWKQLQHRDSVDLLIDLSLIPNDYSCGRK